MEKRELYYRVAEFHLSEQERRNRELETKASIALGFAATVVGITAIVIKNFSGGETDNLSQVAIAFVVALGLAFLSTMANTLHVFWIRRWRRDPHLADFALHLNNPDYTDQAMLEWIGDQFRNSVESNEEIIDTKTRSVKWAMLSLSVQVFMLGGLAVAVLF